MDSRRSSSRASQKASSLFNAVALAAESLQPGRRETQQSGKAQQGSSRRASARKSGRHGSTSSRYSHSSISRASVRGPRGGGATSVDSAGLPFERIACIDEEGRDCTPKPLLPPRQHVEHLPSGGWGGEGTAGSDGSSDQVSMGFGPFTVPSTRSLLASEATEVSLDGAGLPPGVRATGRESALHGRESMQQGGFGRDSVQHGGTGRNSVLGMTTAPSLGHAQPGSGELQLHGQASSDTLWQQNSSTLLRGMSAEVQPLQELLALQQRQQQQQGQQQGQQSQRSRAVGCSRVAWASRGIQVQPWELRPTNAQEVDPTLHPTIAAGEVGDEDAEGDGLDEEEKAALLALQQVAPSRSGSTLQSRRGSVSSYRSGMHSQSSSRRGSMAGLRRTSTMNGMDEWGRPPTSAASSRRTSMQSSEWSARDSMMSSRTSFAAFLGAEGRDSLPSSAEGFYPPGSAGGGRPHTGRGSIMSMGQGHGRRRTQQQQQQQQPAAPLQLTPEQAAAAAARREKAQQERALARMSGLVLKLQIVEKIILLNVQHTQLAQYHSVEPCRVAPIPMSLPAADAQQKAAAEGMAEGAVGQNTGPLGSARGLAEGGLKGLQGSSESSLTSHRRAEGSSAWGSAGTSAGGSGATTPSMSSVTNRQAPGELKLLWSWRSELTAELPVSCLAWSKAAPNLLAVGYGRLEYEVCGSGMLALWSLSNPNHPLWHTTTPCGVSALDWSAKTPGTLAVGFFDGSVAVYDVTSKRNKGGTVMEPLARAPPAGADAGSRGGHSEPVWRLRYIPLSTDTGEEMLVSVSSDGRVMEWKHAQGLERVELMRLKRQQRSSSSTGGSFGRRPKRSSGGGSMDQAASGVMSGSGGLLGSGSGGTCFDFSAIDPRTYLVGTEDGAVHRCSTVFSEQYIQSYSGHLAPIYQVCYSPFSPTHFLTASADWSVRLWSEGKTTSLWTFQLPSSKAEVADVAFSPAAATLFAAAVGNSLQLWDVERSVLAPRGIAVRLGVRLTALAFSQAAPVVVTGADDGVVSVYSLTGMYDLAPVQQDQQRQRLEAALKQHMARNIID